MFRFLHFLLLFCCLVLCGCGKEVAAPEERMLAQQSFDLGMEMMEAGNYETAAQSFADAAMGELPPDLYVVCLFEHAKALTELQQYEEALAKIDEAAQGAEGMDSVHVARAVVYRAKGDTQAQNEEMKKAKAINPKASLPDA